LKSLQAIQANFGLLTLSVNKLLSIINNLIGLGWKLLEVCKNNH